MAFTASASTAIELNYQLPDAFGYGVTELMVAASSNNLKRVKELLEQGWDAKQSDVDDLNVLDYAINHNRREIVQFLDDEGYISIDEKDEDGNTSLHRAIGEDDQNYVAKLLDMGADVDALDEDSNTPLMLAVRLKNYDIVTLLIDDYDADIDHKNCFGYSALDIAIQHGYEEIVERLRESM